MALKWFDPKSHFQVHKSIFQIPLLYQNSKMRLSHAPGRILGVNKNRLVHKANIGYCNAHYRRSDICRISTWKKKLVYDDHNTRNKLTLILIISLHDTISFRYQ